MKKYTDLKEVKDIEKVLNVDLATAVPTFCNYPERHRKSMIAYSNIVLLVESANQLANNNIPWIADFKDKNQRKYEAWFYYDKGSSAFRYHVCDSWYTGSDVGSRLCFISRPVCEYITKQFPDLFNDWLSY